jgi:hypothetical protein
MQKHRNMKKPSLQNQTIPWYQTLPIVKRMKTQKIKKSKQN